MKCDLNVSEKRINLSKTFLINNSERSKNIVVNHLLRIYHLRAATVSNNNMILQQVHRFIYCTVIYDVHITVLTSTAMAVRVTT